MRILEPKVIELVDRVVVELVVVEPGLVDLVVVELVVVEPGLVDLVVVELVLLCLLNL